MLFFCFADRHRFFDKSEIQTESPYHFQTQLQELVYETLKKLQIPFERVDTDEAISMEDCVAIYKAYCRCDRGVIWDYIKTGLW